MFYFVASKPEEFHSVSQRVLLTGVQVLPQRLPESNRIHSQRNTEFSLVQAEN